MTACERVKLVFATTAGDYEDNFLVDQKLGDVKRAVMAKLKLDVCQAGDFVVTLGQGGLREGSRVDVLNATEVGWVPPEKPEEELAGEEGEEGADEEEHADTDDTESQDKDDDDGQAAVAMSDEAEQSG